jgi:hypothetical protein
MKNAKSPARAQRRLYERYLKSNHLDQYKEWKINAQKRGQELQEQFVDATNKGIESQMEEVQNRIIGSHTEFYKCDETESRKYAESVIASTKLWRDETYVKFSDL